MMIAYIFVGVLIGTLVTNIYRDFKEYQTND